MHEYVIQTHTGPVTVLLSDEDAAARGLTKAKAAPKAKPEVEAKAPATSAPRPSRHRSTRNDS
jgi:hypothetical protein